MNIDFKDQVKSYLYDLVTELNNNVYVDKSWMNSAGKGLFAKNEFQTGDIVACYTGVIYNTSNAIKLRDKSYLMRLGTKLYVDARECPLVFARYINDCRNVAGYNVTFDKIESEKYALVKATRPIYKGEEIFVDYGRWYWAGANIKSKGRGKDDNDNNDSNNNNNDYYYYDNDNDNDNNSSSSNNENTIAEQRLSFTDLNNFRSKLEKFKYH